MPKNPIKGYLALALFFGAILIATLIRPLHGWALWLALAVAAPFVIWTMVAVMEAQENRKKVARD